MEYIERAARSVQRTFLEGMCEAVSSMSDTWGPSCDLETVLRPENSWLQAVLAIVVLKYFVHYCWILEIACVADEDKRLVMARHWTISILISTFLTFWIPGPNTPSGFFIALEHIYVPLVIKVLECNSILFL